MNIFSIKDDVRDPAGLSLGRGIAPGYNFTGSADGHPVLHYRGRRGEFFLTADVYKLPGSPLYAILYCPLCQNSLRVSEDNKSIEWEPEGVPSFSGYRPEEVAAALGAAPRGLLSIEPFQCAWEVEPDLRRSYGFAVCPWRVAVERCVVRDA